MKIKAFSVLAGLLIAVFACQAHADMVDIRFSGAGVSGSIQLTYGAATDSKYPQAFEVTGISGTFSDSNNGLNIVNASILSLVAVTHDAPELSNLLAPHDFSRFTVASGLPPQSHGSVSYDNLFWPGGSVPTASVYDGHGGFLDIYGLLFNIGNGRVVNFWSGGDTSGTGNGPFDYGVAVVTSATALDYVGGGVSAVPEPGTMALLGIGLVGLLARRRLRRTRTTR